MAAALLDPPCRIVPRGVGIIGSFSFDRNGDPSFNPTMIFRIHDGKGEFDRVITPPASLIP